MSAMNKIPLSDLTVAQADGHTVISIGHSLGHIGPDILPHYETALDLSAKGFSRAQVACIMNMSQQQVQALATGNRPYPEIHAMNSTEAQELSDNKVHEFERELREVDHLIGINASIPGPRRRENPEVRKRIANQTMRMSQPKARSTPTDNNVNLFVVLDDQPTPRHGRTRVDDFQSDTTTHHSRSDDTHHSPSYSSDSSSSSGSDGGGGGSSD